MVPQLTRAATDVCATDEQIAQMYELMMAIRNKELEENDPQS